MILSLPALLIPGEDQPQSLTKAVTGLLLCGHSQGAPLVVQLRPLWVQLCMKRGS